MDDTRLISTPEAAKILQIDTSTLWRWLKAGKVTPTWTTPNGRHRWDIDDLRRQLGLPVEARPIVLAIVTCERGVLIGKRRDRSEERRVGKEWRAGTRPELQHRRARRG